MWIAAAMTVIVAAAHPPQAMAAGGSALEYQVKAAFLWKFASFTQWPAGDGPLRFCVVGAESLRSGLNEITRGKTLMGRAVEVQTIGAPSEAASCHVVFIAAHERRRMAAVIQSVLGKPVLTISEIPGFAEQGGIINFFVRDNRVQFEINPENARAAGLQISSHVLRLARIVADPRP